MNVGQTYQHGGYSVTIMPDGAINVKTGDQISHYSMAKYRDFNAMDTRFGRKRNGSVKSFKDIAGANINVIHVGETVYDMKTHRRGAATGPKTPKERAHALVAAFAQRSSPPSWFLAFKDKRTRVAAELHERIDDPSKIGQGNAGVCGPTAMMFAFVQDNPVDYATFVITLYEAGRARLGTLEVRPGFWLRLYDPGAGMWAADWIAGASLRNLEDWGKLYPLFHEWGMKDFQRAGPTAPWAIKKWFSQAGYTSAEWGSLGLSDVGIAKLEFIRLNKLVSENYRVVLLINHELENATQSFPARFSPFTTSRSSRRSPSHRTPTIRRRPARPRYGRLHLHDDLLAPSAIRRGQAVA